ncbi:MAG: aryl-sulfate sulfotransferase [Acidimicrobiia bacterium]|nr:aryl-sulfate sulfotransferase [Acidimicrobiia bacterium]
MTTEDTRLQACGHRPWRTRAVVVLATLAVVASACSSDVHWESQNDPPVIDSVTVTENPNSTISAVLNVTTDVPAVAIVIVTGPERQFTIASPDEPGTDVTIPVVGMRPETTYELSVTAVAEGGSNPSVAKTESFTTGALPADFPPLELVTSDPERMEPGFTLFDANGPAPEGKTTGGTGFAIAVDTEGIPVWYYRYEGGVGDVRQLENGDYLMGIGLDRARVVDPLGNVLEEYDARTAVADAESGKKDPLPEDGIEVDTDSLHHEVGLLPNGNIISLSTKVLDLGPYEDPPCNDGTDVDGVYRVVDDIVVEVERETGEIVRQFAISDMIDPASDLHKWVCSVSIGGLADALYDLAGLREWMHANAVIYDEDRNALIVSNRESDLILAIRYEDDENGPAGELLWSFGPEGDVELESGEFMYHQHAPQLLPDGTFMFFDNGNDRPGHEDDPYSRAVRFEIDDSDPDNVVARQVWEFKPMLRGEYAYSFFVGDADMLPNGNVLVSSGGIIAPGRSDRPIYEVVPDDDDEGGEVVWQLIVVDTDGLYRAERVETLTPWDS